MRKALIVWGGWDGHEPEQCAEIIAGWLREDGFEVTLENTTGPSPIRRSATSA